MKLSRRDLLIVTVILVVLSTLPLYVSGYSISLLTIILMYATMSVSWIIFSGYTGYISLGTAAYITVLFWPTLPLPVIIVLGGLASAALALILGFPFLRIRGPYFIVATLGLSELVRYIVENYQTYVLHRVGIPLLDTPSTEVLYYALLAVCVITVIVAHIIKKSKFGFGLSSIRGDEEAAKVMGVDTTRYKLFAFAISSAFMGCVGAIIALRWTWIEPFMAFNPMISFQVVIMALLGGVGNFRGPIIGAIILILVQEAFGITYPTYYMILLGVIVVLLVKFFPAGILGGIDKLRSLKKER